MRTFETKIMLEVIGIDFGGEKRTCRGEIDVEMAKASSDPFGYIMAEISQLKTVLENRISENGVDKCQS